MLAFFFLQMVWYLTSSGKGVCESQNFHFDTGANKTQGTVPLEWQR